MRAAAVEMSAASSGDRGWAEASHALPATAMATVSSAPAIRPITRCSPRCSGRKRGLPRLDRRDRSDYRANDGAPHAARAPNPLGVAEIALDPATKLIGKSGA